MQTLTAGERGQFEVEFQAAAINKDPELMRAALAGVKQRLVALCLVNKHNERLLADADADALGNQDAAIVDKLFELAADHAGISNTDLKELSGN